MNILDGSLGKLDALQDVTEDNHSTLLDIKDNVETIVANITNVTESLNIFRLWDQLHMRTKEISNDTKQLIQELTLTNTKQSH